MMREATPFSLAPWELPPGSIEPLEGVAGDFVTAEWLGEKRQFYLRQVEIAPSKFVVFAREVDSLAAGNWIVCRFRVAFRPRGLWEESPTPKDYRNSSLARACWTEISYCGQQNLCLVRLMADGRTGFEWVNPEALFASESDRDLADGLPFSFDGQHLAKAPASEWINEFHKQLAQPESKARFALRWLNLSYRERADSVMVCQRGSYRELRQVLEWVLQCDPAIRWQSFDLYRVFDFLETQDTLWKWLQNVSGSEHYPISPFLCQWREAVLRWFDLGTNQKLVAQHPCVCLFCGDNYDWVTVSVSSPTHHERLEARLALRKWVRGKVPDELLNTLPSR